MPPKTARRASATRTDRRRAALQRRRDQTAARSAAARRAVRRQRRRRVLAGSLAVVVVAGAVLAFIEFRPKPGAPSPVLHAALVSDASGPLGMSGTPGGYHALYQAESYDGAKVTRSTEDVTVQRPFNGRVAIREGTTPSGALQFEGRSMLGLYSNNDQTGTEQVSGDAPAVAFGDVRIGTSIDTLVSKGLFVLRERRHTLGQDCQVYRTGSPLQSLKITAPTATDYADACINSDGLPLEEVTVVGGKLTQRLTATELVNDPGFEPTTFAITGPPVGFDQGGSVLTPLDVNASPAPGYWQLDPAPAGFDHTGRYQLLSPNQATQGAGDPLSSYVDLYVKGNDILVVRQGATESEPDISSAASAGDPVDLGPLGSAQLMLSSIGPIVAAHPGTDTFVQMTGTMSPADLQALTGGLHQA
ncbi:MAG TPA: hypothetical protein VHT97_03550 [Acidimicrobiales bacterium]|nr:hypothetical protein [Acidimicrobiales bacterium]